MAHRNSGVGCLVGVVLLGIFMMFYNNLGFFYYPFSPMFITMIAGIVIIVVMISAISSKASHKGNNNNHIINNIPINYDHTFKNPYIIANAQKTIPVVIEQKSESLEKSPTIAQYCQFCGVKRERDSIFCHNCGTRL